MRIYKYSDRKGKQHIIEKCLESSVKEGFYFLEIPDLGDLYIIEDFESIKSDNTSILLDFKGRKSRKRLSGLFNRVQRFELPEDIGLVTMITTYGFNSNKYVLNLKEKILYQSVLKNKADEVSIFLMNEINGFCNEYI